MNLGQRCRGGEPVKSLRAHHHIDTGIGQRNGLGSALMGFDLRIAAGELVEHGLHRLDHNHPRARL